MSDESKDLITAEWLEQIGAVRRGPWLWLDDTFGFIEGFQRWFVLDARTHKVFDATNREQIDQLLKSLRGAA